MLGRILVELGRLVLPAALLYVALLALSLWLFPPATEPTLDSERAAASFLATPPAYVTFRATALANDRPTLVLMGASNVGTGFHTDQLGALLPGFDVHSLVIGGNNVDGMRSTVELVYANRPPAERGNLILVLGLWYGMFLHEDSNLGQTPVAAQLRRFGLYQAQGEGFERRLSAPAFDMAVTLLRPFVLVQSLLGPHGPVAQHLFAAAAEDGAAAFIPPQLDSRDFPLPQAQFSALTALVRRVEAMGGKLVLVDLPLPKTAAGAAPLWRRYQQAKLPILAEARAHGAVIIDMQDMNCDCDFGDGTHPLATAAPRWSARLAAKLKSAELIR